MNRDVSQAPKDGTLVILATKCGKVTRSYWMEAGKERKIGRWQMLNEGEEPVAWMLWPAHPDKESQ